MSLVINGELLKAARLRRGLSIASWASELMVSETQLRSLEEGSDRGFYNQSHRAQIAQKYAAVLGVDRASLHSAPPPKHGQPVGSPSAASRGPYGQAAVVSGNESVWKSHDMSMALADAHDGAGGSLGRRGKLSSKRARSEYWFAGTVLASLAVWFSVDAWQHHRTSQKTDPLAVVEQRFDDPPSAINARRVELSDAGNANIASAKPSEPDYPQPFVNKPGAQDRSPRERAAIGDRGDAKTGALRKDGASINTQSASQAQFNHQAKSRAQASAAPQAGQDQLAALSKELPYPDRQATAISGLQAPQTPQQPAPALVAAAPASGMEARNVDLCEVSDQVASIVVPVSRLKNTPYVHVASGVSQRVCVRSADGRIERLSLSANEARSIFGKAPFTVVTEQPSSVEIFYLGARVRHNGESRVLKIVDPDPLS